MFSDFWNIFNKLRNSQICVYSLFLSWKIINIYSSQSFMTFEFEMEYYNYKFATNLENHSDIFL